jgi:hypothetical protein
MQKALKGRGWLVAALPRHGEPTARLFRGEFVGSRAALAELIEAALEAFEREQERIPAT